LSESLRREQGLGARFRDARAVQLQVFHVRQLGDAFHLAVRDTRRARQAGVNAGESPSGAIRRFSTSDRRGRVIGKKAKRDAGFVLLAISSSLINPVDHS